MKKITLSLIACLISLMVSAQVEHMKFMGIPLNGTITSFQSKLQAKGVKYDPIGSKQLGFGCRCFKGTFSNEKADFYVYYNEKTKIVYRAKAVITCYNKEDGNRKFATFYGMLKSKYSDGEFYDGEQEGHPTLSILVPGSKQEKALGYVGLYIANSSVPYIDEVYLHIDYEDLANKNSSQKKNMDDL
ncbi:hypothetical protein [Prevotella sp. P6B1]|uniref:hypothetical protein n=1 Tax=Prevotella sp. P6B1 TaxID=1410613 RepID=UPI00068EBE05|nr:hypothetical protein [Prevotella sp. P6B1]